MSCGCGCQCGQVPEGCASEFQYAVKLVCGEIKINSTGNYPELAPGRYWTAINIHNPDKCRDAHFRWKVAIAHHVYDSGLTLAYQKPVRLRPDEATEIDCSDLSHIFPVPQPFMKGFVVLESDIELDVVAVYTGTRGGNDPLATFHTERVAPRCVPICTDLTMTLNTGVALWQTIAPTTGPVALVQPLSGGWTTAPPIGSAWVSQFAGDGAPVAMNPRSYQLCFNLCFGFVPPVKFPIQIMADNTAQLYLNGNQIPGPAPSATTIATFIVDPSQTPFNAGQNCFQIDVPNIGHANNPSGFALAGVLHVAKGACPCVPCRLTH